MKAEREVNEGDVTADLDLNTIAVKFDKFGLLIIYKMCCGLLLFIYLLSYLDNIHV